MHVILSRQNYEKPWEKCLAIRFPVTSGVDESRFLIIHTFAMHKNSIIRKEAFT